MKKWTWIVVGVAAASLWCGQVFAQERFGMGWHGQGMMLPLLIRGAGLTADQKAQVQGIVTAHQPTFRALVQQLRAAQGQLADQVFKGLPADQLTASVQQLSQLRQQLLQESLNVALEVRALLTPDQLAKAAQLRAQIQALRAQIRSLLQETP